jgi:hypothetical protein
MLVVTEIRREVSLASLFTFADSDCPLFAGVSRRYTRNDFGQTVLVAVEDDFVSELASLGQTQSEN